MGRLQHPQIQMPGHQPLLSKSRDHSPYPISTTRSITANSSETSKEKNPRKSAQKLHNSWSLEIGALLLGAASFGALLYLLVAYDGKPISEWKKFPLSLNAVVSILAGVTQAALAFVVSMCLSQGKWNWAAKFVEPLVDFDRFDAASRGAWGSARLVLSTFRRPHWVSLGALTVIMLIGFEPFLQVVLDLEDESRTMDAKEYSLAGDSSSTGPGIGRASSLDAGSWVTLKRGSLMATRFTLPDGKNATLQTSLTRADIREDIGMAAAVYNGFSPLVSEQNLWPAFSCATGNCTWESFSSLAVCSSCYDISDRIEKYTGLNVLPTSYGTNGWDLSGNNTLPDVSNDDIWANEALLGKNLTFTKYGIPEVGLNLSNYDGERLCKPGVDACPDTYVSATYTTNPGKTISFKDLRTMVLAFQFLEADKTWKNGNTTWEETPITAQECSLHFCINEYEAVLEQGVLKEKVVSSWTNKTEDSYMSDQTNVKEYLEWANHTLDMGTGFANMSDLQIYIPDEDFKSHSRKQQEFNITQPSIMSLLNVFALGLEDPECLNCSYSNAGALIYPSNGGNRLPAFMVGMGESGNVSWSIGNVASSLTKWMRDRELETSPMVGEATRMIIITRVRWNYLGFPAATLLVGLVFALLSIWETHRLRKPAWKDSALATLAHAPEGELRERLRAAETMGELSVVGKTKVALEYHDDRAVLVSKEQGM
ncbi:hypothetical protein ACJ41O_005790 [Fusarium nematophilum]